MTLSDLGLYVGYLRFWEISRLTPTQRERLADLLSTIACEIRKGAHRSCTGHELWVNE